MPDPRLHVYAQRRRRAWAEAQLKGRRYRGNEVLGREGPLEGREYIGWMATSEADREAAAFLNRAKWVIIPVAAMLMIATFALFAMSSSLAPFAFGGLVAFAIVWNIAFALWRYRLSRRYEDGNAAPAMIRDQATGRFVPANPAPSLLSRFARGARSMLRSTAVEATSTSPLPEVQSDLARAVEQEGVTCAWKPTPHGSTVEWRVHPNVRNRIFMIAGGELRQEPTQTTFVGTIRPDAMMMFGLIPMVIFGIGGSIALIAGIGVLAFGSGDRSSGLFPIAWGGFGVVFSTVWIWAHTKAYEVHVRILHAVFGDDVRLG